MRKAAWYLRDRNGRCRTARSCCEPGYTRRMQFSEILSSVAATGNSQFRITVTEDWGQGRATFGGLVAAAGNEAMRRLVPSDRPLRSLQTTFVGPAGPGTWSMHARVLRVGRAVTLAHCDILDGDQ